jgi:hypothetical protein
MTGTDRLTPIPQTCEEPTGVVEQSVGTEQFSTSALPRHKWKST